MAEPVKIKFDYKNPENVEAEVPGAQPIREAQVESETGEVSSNHGEPSSAENGETSKENPENGERVSHPEEEGNDVITRHDRRHVFSGKRNGIHGEPVMLDKLEDKRSKTKIPISRFRQTVEKVKEERRDARAKKEHGSHIPVRRSSIPKLVKENKVPSTTVTKEITITKTLIKNDSAGPVATKTVMTKKTTEPNVTNTHTETIVTTTEIDSETIKPEDEFDKIYAEIVTTPTEVVLDVSLLNPKVEDPEKLESKFEEIIHDYVEHKLEPIDVEVVRRSKLPLLKRKSQQNIELSAQAERTSKIIAARDKLRLRNSMNKDENFEEALDYELNNTNSNSSSNINQNNNPASANKVPPKVDTKIETETKHQIITSPTSKTEITRQFTKTVSTSSANEQENVVSSSILETTTVKDVSTNEVNEKKEHKQHYIEEENVIKDSIKIGIPVFDSFIHEYSETNETAKTTEVKRILSYTSNNNSEELSVKNNNSELKNEINVSEIKNNTNTKSENADSYSERQSFKNKDSMVEFVKSENVESLQSVNMEKNTEPIQESVRVKEAIIDEDLQLRGKVERIISKIDSKEAIETEGNQRESINELRKKKSVLSKIAMFERKPEEQILTRAPKKETKLPKLITKDWQIVEHIHVHTPLIVDEVYKPFSTDISFNGSDNKDEIPLNNDEMTTIVRAERVTVENPNTVHYAAGNKVQIENKTKQGKPTELISSQYDIETVHNKAIEVIPTQANVDSEYTLQKIEIATIEDVLPSRESNITEDIASPKTNADKFELKDFKHIAANPTKLRVSREFSYNNDKGSPRPNADKFDFKDASNKTLSPTRLSMTKELLAPVVIPGFKPVSELLRSFESKQETNKSYTKRSVSKVEHQNVDTQIHKVEYKSVDTQMKVPEIAAIIPAENQAISTQISHTNTNTSEIYDDFEVISDYKSLDDVFSRDTDMKLKLRHEEDFKRAKSLAELDLGDAVKGKVNNMIMRMRSVDRVELERREAINKKEMPRKRSVSEKIALFEGKLTPSRSECPLPLRIFKADKPTEPRTEQKTHSRPFQHTTRTEISEYSLEIQTEKSATERLEKTFVDEPRSHENDQEVEKKIEELRGAKINYEKIENMPEIELSNKMKMPVLAVGTALLDPRLTYHIITAAIDLGYRAIDTAFIYGNEREIGEAIRAKITDGTVKREELFIISKLWSTFHRTDLVEGACRASLDAMGLEYFDLYLIHNPMSFKEGGAAIPKIATVIQYSEHDYLEAWYGVEQLVTKGLVRAVGVSNFNSAQLQRVLDKGRVKPVVNQVECHPYLSQQRLDLFCTERNVTLNCFGVLGSKGTPLELKNSQPAVIDDALVQVMASGLGITAAQLLISYQLENNHTVVVKASSGRHLYDNLLATRVTLTTGQVDALHALNRNKRMFTFKGMGDTHKNYPFNVAY